MSTIPVIDVGGRAGSAADIEKLAAEFEAVARTVGFMYIVNHGISDDRLSSTFEASRWFHALPMEERLKLKVNKWHRGYEPPYSVQLKKSAKFAPAKKPSERSTLLIRHEMNPADEDYPMNGPNQWPDDPDFRTKVGAYDSAMVDLGMSLLPAFSIAMGQDSDFLTPRFSPPSTTLSLLRYAASAPDREEDDFGSAPHTDYGFMTFLTQDNVGGLEVQAVDGTWIAAPPMPGAYIVNMGDAVARWTNDKFRSTAHRVINKSAQRDRYSIAFFFDPNPAAVIDVLPKFLGQGEKPAFEPIKFGAYHAGRIASNTLGTNQAAPI